MTTTDVIVGIDTGTSVIKAVAFDRDGRQLAVAGLANRYDEWPGGRLEQDLERTWDDTARALRDLAGHVDHLHGRVAALAVMGQGDGTWLIDRARSPPLSAAPRSSSITSPR